VREIESPLAVAGDCGRMTGYPEVIDHGEAPLAEVVREAAMILIIQFHLDG
jgi:hypothetical protein